MCVCVCVCVGAVSGGEEGRVGLQGTQADDENSVQIGKQCLERMYKLLCCEFVCGIWDSTVLVLTTLFNK